MALEQLVKVTFNESFKKYIYDEMVVGQLAHTEFKDGVKNQEVDIIMPGSASLFDYTGDGDLPDAEKVTNSTVKVRLDKGKGFHFELNKFEEEQLKAADSPEKQVNLIKEYSSDAVKQFASAVDEAYASLWTRAGIKGDVKAPITIDGTNAREALAYMATYFQRGDKKGHNSWVEGKMICIVPPEYQFQLGNMEELKYVESGHKKMAKGYIGHLAGWDIVVSNTIKPDKDNVYHLLFGIKGKTLAGGISKDLHTESYKPEKNFNTRYKGYGLYGVGAPRADYLGTLPIKMNLSITPAANA